MLLYYNKHLINKSTQILNKSCKPSPCAIAKQVLKYCNKPESLQANHQVDEVKFKIIIVMVYFDFEKLTSKPSV